MKRKSLREMYEEKKKQPSPAASFIEDIAAKTHRSKAAVRKWVTGLAEPDTATKILLSERLAVPYDVLFPITKNHDKR